MYQKLADAIEKIMEEDMESSWLEKKAKVLAVFNSTFGNTMYLEEFTGWFNDTDFE